MILVTGTMRSGTSLWMQILLAAGLPGIGTAFPARWKEHLSDANARGFYESALRWGIYYRTNPHPKTGSFLPPAATARHAVKVFVPGLVRTDLAYVNHVVATMRPWPEYVASIARLRALNDAAREGRPARPTPPSDLVWWVENYRMLRDFSVRRYPHHVVTYGALLREPDRVIRETLAFLGEGDVQAALACVNPQLRSQDAPDVRPQVLTLAELGAMEEVYARIDEGRPVPPKLLSHLNELWRDIRRRAPPAPDPDPWSGAAT